ncbi:TonB-dependent receptor [Labilibaculum sp. DW002]|uniref:TonB-dependent receptor n=1 Tax=Paralabilibaculum antarcticum TaxID=2912572 RepID=A0ABT5VTS4_9BACT|nr:TonB-dependent receptor [Labilibaculum sp. DW002]MDE5418824.1 TonB-dependent receptor [Labilibaculum sp. DW002]
MKKTVLFLILAMFCLQTFAQKHFVNGIVRSSEDGVSLPFASVVIKGTTIGTSTDFDGKFIIEVSKEDVLVFSLIGFSTQEILVGDKTEINVILKTEATGLDEVVVVGYGVQKKSVVTASIAKVSSEDLDNIAPVRIDNALKGLASGVTVTSTSGQPGASSQVRIRGIGTINNSDPLYIVDGMPIGGGIDYLNPSDIQSVEVLKDAASGAVYGARAANGVILITTKNGSKGKLSVNYNFSKGLQSKWNKRDVLNAQQYALLINEGLVNSGEEKRYDDPYALGKGTDWQDEVFYDNAPVENHQLSVSGGSDKVLYYFSAGYYKQDGIVGGNFDRSNYERISLRSNTTYNLLDNKDRNFLNKFTAGVNIAYTRINSKGIGTNSEYGSALGGAISFSPLLGLYEEDQAAAAALHPTAVRDSKNGLIYTIAGDDYNEITNPVAQLALPGGEDNSDKFVSSFWGELNIWDNLKIRSSFGTDLAFWGNDGWTPEYYLGKSSYVDDSKVWSSMNRGFTWQVENILTYEKSINEKHNFNIMLGQSAKKTTGRSLSGSNKFMVEENGDKANIDFTTGTAANGDQTAGGGAWSPHTLSSIFARLSYNFSEKYMFQATIRRDGSSNFGPGKKYGTFSSFSFGWNITKEAFMESRPEWFTSSKLRASWGKNGNENIGAFGYTALTSTGNNYAFGPGDGTLVNGTKASGLANTLLAWEESEQTDIGLDFGFLDNALTFTVDYYDKKTNGMLMTMAIPSYVGESKPTGNVGDMKNWGVEFDLGYRFKIGDLNFKLSGNASYLENELVNLGNADGFANYDGYANVGTISRAENGMPFPFFYGYKTDGIFQNASEVNAHVNNEGGLIQGDAVPGDVRFVDINGDGTITDEDRTKIGKGMPDWTYGLNIGIDYKGFDFSMMLQGTVGNDIYDATRRTDLRYINLPAYMLDRWTGEGTSNTIPRFSFSDNNGNWLSSDLYVKEGDYMRVKNVTLGYTLPKNLVNKAFVKSLRFYVSAENLFTFTKYEGFDPEISSGGTSLGIDRGIYPQARTYTVGVNLSF